MSERNFKVVVVGAGIAGLFMAEKTACSESMSL
jgi:flavin-dependent dehydrogenase